MIKIENAVTPSGVQWEAIIRGTRNPMNSWAKSDSQMCGSGSCDICVDYDNCPFHYDPDKLIMGEADRTLMMNLAHGGPVHAKYRRMITVYLDITAPLYWWKEFDTYKVGTVANSCSTMHKIHAKEFELDDFSHERMTDDCCEVLMGIIKQLNFDRDIFVNTRLKEHWYSMIQLLPTSYNQKRTVMLTYEVLANMYESRKNHKLDEWREFCKWIESLPYSEIIIGEKVEE